MNKTAVSIALTVFVLLVLVKIFNISYPLELKVVNSNAPTDLSVNGEGKVDVTPDVAVVDAGISVSRARTAADAQERMARVNNAIIEGVKGLGIKEADITTSNYSINPEYDYSPVIYDTKPAIEPSAPTSVPADVGTSAGGAVPENLMMPQQPPASRIIGYNGTATVTIKIRNTAQTSAILAKVTAAGANNVGSPRFTVDNIEKYREEARNKAIANAKEQAQKLAKQLGVRLGKVTNFVEGGGNYPYPVYDRAMGATMNAEAKSTPPTIEEGTQTITSTVTLYFERK